MNQVLSPKQHSLSLRELLWPIYGREHRIWLPMASMVGLILFNYTIARNLKDSLVVTATGSSELIPFLKLGLVLPASLIFFLIYGQLAQRIDRRSLFYVVLLAFLLFFGVFGLVLYPVHECLHPTQSADILQAWLPHGLKGLADCYRVWTFSAFYVASELWGVVVNSLLFWQFANDVIKVEDAKRYYAHFYLLANAFVTCSGLVVSYVSQNTVAQGANLDRWAEAIRELTIVMLVAGALILILYAYLDRIVFKQSQAPLVQDKLKLKLSTWDGIKFVIQSRYLGLMALLIICYGLTVNLIEITWKRQLVLLYPSGNDYANFMGYLSTATGLGTIIAIFAGSIVLRKMGWFWAALATPLVVGICGALFFLGVLFPNSLALLAEYLNFTPLFLTVIVGFVLEILVKSIKYALFDPTKEMAYIPLDSESKIRGKAAVDVVASRLGKSGGGLLEILLIALAGTLSGALGYFALTFVIFSGIWLAGVFGLNRLFKSALDNQIK
jgi:AAA family ATP:ADP antiporter